MKQLFAWLAALTTMAGSVLAAGEVERSGPAYQAAKRDGRKREPAAGLREALFGGTAH